MVRMDNLSAANVTSSFFREVLTALIGFIQRLLYPTQGVAEWAGIEWRLPPESGGGMKRNQVALSSGIRWRLAPEYAVMVQGTGRTFGGPEGERHERGLLTSVEFLKELLNLARDVVTAERAQPPIAKEEEGKAALTELFHEAKNSETPIIVERVVNDIDEIVRYVRFDGWQNTHAGKREVKLALRKTLFKYRLHQDQELFNRAYGYIRQYY